jgi:hypothetical protein
MKIRGVSKDEVLPGGQDSEKKPARPGSANRASVMR